ISAAADVLDEPVNVRRFASTVPDDLAPVRDIDWVARSVHKAAANFSTGVAATVSALHSVTFSTFKGYANRFAVPLLPLNFGKRALKLPTIHQSVRDTVDRDIGIEGVRAFSNT